MICYLKHKLPLSRKEMTNFESEYVPLLWLSEFDVYKENTGTKKTGIICTLTDKVNTPEKLIKLRNAGMNIVRMNFSHGSHEYHKATIDNVRKTFKDDITNIALALDTKGPEIRIGDIESNRKITIEKGQQLVLTTDEAWRDKGNNEVLYVDYKKLPSIVLPGKLVYVDDGVLSLEVIECLEDSVRVCANNTHTISSRKGVNLPYTNVDLPAISEKDKKDILFAVENSLDMIFASFIRKKQDIEEIRSVLGEKGKNILVIAKIESHEGITNFESILEAADGIMVARGDLGIEIPPEKVFVAQKKMIALCNRVGKPIVCATQMLESMIKNPRATRAEVSDVANAVLDGADCVMLSGETAAGDYPIEAVTTMSNVCKQAEISIPYKSIFEQICRYKTKESQTITEIVAQSVVKASHDKKVRLIVSLTITGETTALISKYRPDVPILVVTKCKETARKTLLYRGCLPLLCPKNKKTDNWQNDIDRRFTWAINWAKKQGLVQKGDLAVLVQGLKSGTGHTNNMKIVSVD